MYFSGYDDPDMTVFRLAIQTAGRKGVLVRTLVGYPEANFCGTCQTRMPKGHFHFYPIKSMIDLPIAKLED